VSGVKYRTVIFDVDSTLSSIEGIEWLAGLRGADVYAEVNAVTERAMRGELEFDGVYAARLDLVRPTYQEIIRLGDAYIEALSPGAEECIGKLRAAKVHVVIVSGGIRNAVLHLANHLGIPERDAHAVPLHFDDSGEYAGYDTRHPCSMQLGKRAVILSLRFSPPTLLVGDGMTDAEVKPAVDAFAAFTGAVRREEIVKLADFELASFQQLFDHITE